MRPHPIRLALCLLLAATACGGGISAKVDVDPVIRPRISSWKTWAWFPAPGGSDARASAAIAGPVMRDVEAALVARGYQRVDSVPDALVGWHAALEGVLDVNEVSSYYGYTYGRWYPGGGVTYSPRYLLEYPEGTILIDLVDARSRELAWRGRATVDPKKLKSAAARDRVIGEAVRAIVASFRPPTPK